MVTSFVLNNPINRINDLINIYLLIIALFIYRFFCLDFYIYAYDTVHGPCHFFVDLFLVLNAINKKKVFLKKEKSLRKKRLMQNYLHELDIVNVTKK